VIPVLSPAWLARSQEHHRPPCNGKPQRLAAAASGDEGERVMAPADRASAPGFADSSFPARVQTGLSAAPAGPAPQARQNPPDQAPGRRR